MPDYGRPAEDLEQLLERSLAIFPQLDYGSTLLSGAHLPSHPPSGGRKLNGGIMMRQGYRGPTVNIRPPKWTDNTFWIRAENYPDAKYIADAVFYHIGRGPFHFLDANFQYPPLRLATCELLTREACSAYVESIAKGSALQKQREDYRERVKELVLKAVKSPEAVLFLSSLRPAARSEATFEATEETETPDNGTEAATIEEDCDFADVPVEEVVGNDVGDEFAEQGSPMEVDGLSELAIQTLLPYPSDMVSETEDLTGGLAYIATFGIDWFDCERILRNDGQSLDAGWNHSDKAEERCTFFGDLKDLMSTLDKEEEELWSSTDSSDWMSLCPQPNTGQHTLRYNRGLPPPYLDYDTL